MKKVGRPSAKTPEMVTKIVTLAKEGKTNRQIARIVGIAVSTLGNWQRNDWRFMVSLRENKHIADEMVEVGLFKRATGYDYTEEASTREGIVELRRHAPPDPTSMIFWLKNRKPQEWKDKREEEHKILVLKQELVSGLPTEQLLQEAQRLIQEAKVVENGGDPVS